MNTHVLLAVFRRNFVSYFSSPTGYVFICVFVLLCALAAFCPVDFFNNNLDTLDQLSWGIQFLGFNFGFPLIMLAFIPAVTMGIWADERKQGTDELLLTIPASDFDIVLGKYMAAVAIFTVALGFSLVCNFAVLSWLGKPDVGLFLSTYVGYWLIGLAMLAIGAIASFLTSNLTIAFILGAALNAPLVFGVAAEAFLGSQAAGAVKKWSIQQQFSDFGHGVLTLAGVAYFLMIVVVMLYVSVALIGRRHWFSGERRWVMAGHFVLRTLALVAIAAAVVMFCQYHDLRADATSERLSSLSPETYKLIDELNVDRPVQIEAFISPTVPEGYVQTRANLENVLRELAALGGKNVQLHIYDTEPNSSEAALAGKRYGIEPHRVMILNRGAMSEDFIFLNVAMSCGLQKVPPVFIDRGIPVEYELVRSIMTVSQQKRKKLGVLGTDAQLYGSFNMQTMSPASNWPIIDELEKQYDVVRVDPSKPITEKFDAMLAVQPSSLGPQEMNNFIAAVENGQPTAIFEDPAPVFAGNVPATSARRQPPGGMNPMMMGMQQPPPKGDIAPLWQLLGVDFVPDQIIWQNYNPYPKASQFPREFVFVDQGCGAQAPFNADNPISAGLQQLLFPFPGAVTKLHAGSPDLTFTPLVTTGDKTGTVVFGELMQTSPFGPRGGLNPDRRQTSSNMSYVLAAQIQGKVKLAPAADAEPKIDKKAGEKKDEEKKPRESNVNVVVVCDIDMLSQDFFRLREQGDMPEVGINFNFDNVTFVLNVLDELAGDRRFIDIRKRRPLQRTLTRVEESTKEAKQKDTDAREKFVKEYQAREQKEQQAMVDTITELRKRKDVDPQQLLIEVAMKQQDLERQREAALEQAREERNRKVAESQNELAQQVRKVQSEYKLWAVLLPPIPPLLVAFVVFFTRRSREREGVARSRLR